jgi:SAM-dependent methyltransferase
VYTRLVLYLYDPVLWRNNHFAWRCPTSRILAFYNRHVGRKHLDVGVGTGYYLDRCFFPGGSPEAIGLLDLNENSLAFAARRIARHRPETFKANALEPVDLGDRRFDSIGLNYLLHCLPGTIEEKASLVFRHLKPYLAPGGVLFGGTVLAKGVSHNRFSSHLMRSYNESGIFSNTADDLEGLRRALSGAFGTANVEVCGAVALFAARESAAP